MVLALLASALVGCEREAPQRDPAALIKPTYETVLRDDNAAIASAEARLQGPIDSALLPLGLVGLYVERARLTGDYEDYRRAEGLLARLEPKFAGDEGYCLTRAKLHYTLHRLARAKEVLDGCPRISGQAEDVALRADIAFHSGRYRDAGIIYRALVNQLGTPQAYIQLALYSAKTGAPGEAAAFMEAAEKRYHGGSALQKSWFALQRGLIELDRGRYDEARALFALADERLPGYWLNEEHLAEVTQLKGDSQGARLLYEAVVRKSGAPEYLDALGSLHAASGETGEAKRLLDRAEAIYSDRERRFPEAIAGHALEHYLDQAPQPAAALRLAEANFRNRPYGDAAVGLAKAYLLNDRPDEAARLLERQIAQGWDTAEIHWILSLAARAAGDGKKADRAAQEAARRNPHSQAQYAFGY